MSILPALAYIRVGLLCPILVRVLNILFYATTTTTGYANDTLEACHATLLLDHTASKCPFLEGCAWSSVLVGLLQVGNQVGLYRGSPC